ncbi:MAG: ATP-binding protein [Rhodopseudomonas palustris]|nr:ATP-binding protein [Rhodopseudomonas palustris]
MRRRLAAAAAKASSRHVPETGGDYTAADIEVLEGLERAPPARHVYRRHRRAGAAPPGRRGHRQRDGRGRGRPRQPASRWNCHADGILTVRDNGRGIPVDPHPKFTDKSALEVIMTHAARRRQVRRQASYETSGGLHGVGVSVVNALSDQLDVEVARDQQLYVQSFRTRQAEAAS